MRGLFLLGLSALIFTTLPAADEYVTTPEGKRFRLEMVKSVNPPLYGDGILLTYHQYVDDQGNTVLHGIHTKVSKYGDLLEMITYAHGKRDGRFVKYYDDGVTETEGRYREGQLDGTIVWYYTLGHPEKKLTFAMGELNGPFALYFENGNLQEEGAFAKGQKSGPFVEYHPDGAKASEGTYEDGFFQGRLAVYAPGGLLRGKGEVRRDRIVSAWRCYGADGAPTILREDCRDRLYFECSCE